MKFVPNVDGNIIIVLKTTAGVVPGWTKISSVIQFAVHNTSIYYVIYVHQKSCKYALENKYQLSIIIVLNV